MDKNGRIINRYNLMDIIVTGNNNGALVIQKKMASDLTAQWRIDNTGLVVSKYNEQLITFDDTGKITHLYTWENFESNSQKWYFEIVDDKKWTSAIVRGTKEGPLNIPNLKIRPSINFSYYGWVKISSPEIMAKGNMVLNINYFHIETGSGIESCNFNTLASDSFLHLGVIVNGQTLIIYVNGQPYKTCSINELLVLNANPLVLNGTFQNFNYCN